MDPDDRLKEAFAAVKRKQAEEKQRLEDLAMTPPPRQQIGEIRNFTSSPRKVNSYAKLIRKMSAVTAIEQLTFMQHVKAARCVLQCLKTTLHNARVNQKLSADNLWVSHSWVGRGARNKKEIDIKGRGRFGTIVHRKSHYFLVLEEGQPPVKQSKFIQARSGQSRPA